MNRSDGYGKLVGRENVISRLVSAIKNERVSHAWIFEGEDGSGKLTLARLFAMSLLCMEQKGGPCMSCSSCRKAQSMNHPDIITVLPAKNGFLSVDDIRRSPVGDSFVKPYESRYKIYIIPDADKMNIQAQNALLKTLEEPPGYCVILLLASNADAFLPTITSRSVILRLSPVRDEDVKKYLTEREGLSESKGELTAAFARGNIGRAKLIASSEEYEERISTGLSYLKNSRNADAGERMAFIKAMTADKGSAAFYLELFTMWFRDVVLFKTAGSDAALIFEGEKASIGRMAGNMGLDALGKVLRELKTAAFRLSSNVNPELTAELLLSAIKDS